MRLNQLQGIGYLLLIEVIQRGVPFLPRVEYKRVRGSASGGASPYKTSALTIPPGIAFGGTILAGSPFATRI